jgi:hypothetical protein
MSIEGGRKEAQKDAKNRRGVWIFFLLIFAASCGDSSLHA